MKRFIPVHAGALALGLLAALAGPARGATVLRLTFEELTARADAVVRGRVVGSAARMDQAAGRITTFTEVEVAEALKGAPGKKLTVRQPGGEVGGIGQSVPGAARFAPGEEVVLFLERVPGDAPVYQVLSLSAGKVRLEKKLSTLRAVRDLDGIHFPDQPPAPPAAAAARPPAAGASKPAAPSGVKVVSSEDLGDAQQFLGRIRAAAASAKKAVKP
ncbi:MAG TPA: hypothetical protein VND93_12415 [Myxococcales bacterium]|jgi:hypothetical protein|nr:hypothetical protein [Myxococcales bacterium]